LAALAADDRMVFPRAVSGAKQLDALSPARAHDIFKLLWHRAVFSELPKLIHKENLFARPALADFKNPMAEPAETLNLLGTREHDMRVEADPATRDGRFTLSGSAARPELETAGRLATVIENKA